MTNLPLITSPADLSNLLDEGMEMLSEGGASVASCRESLTALKAHLGEGRLHLAVLGQVKRGKSTLINALLGETVLPTAVVPLTSIPTFILHSQAPCVRVTFANGHVEELRTDHDLGVAGILSQFVTEAGNPQNRRNVTKVEVHHPSPLLRDGVVLIDTPGIGSTLHHNTETTLGFLPECDAALFIVSTDPPITAAEVEFLNRVRGQVSRIYFVMNKSDYLTQAERVVAVDFLRRAIREQSGITDKAEAICVSARNGLKAMQTVDQRGWADSGMEEVKRRIIDQIASGKTGTLRSAVAKKASAVLSDAIMRIQLAVRSSRIPVTELEQRVSLLDREVADAKRERFEAGDTLAADAKRIVKRLYEREEELREKMASRLRPVVEKSVGAEQPTEHGVREAMAEVLPGLFDDALACVSVAVEAEVAKVLELHRCRADEMVELVRRCAASAFDIPYRPLPGPDDFRPRGRPAWATHQWYSPHGPFTPAMFDWMLPLRWRRSRIKIRAMKMMHTLVVRNVGGLRLRLQEMVEDTFRGFARRLDERLGDTIAATQGVLTEVRDRRRQSTREVAVEAERLEAVSSRLAEVRADLEQIGGVQ